MKNLKRIICALLTLVLSFCAVNAVMAATTGTVTVKNAVDGKYYSIYRIFDLCIYQTRMFLLPLDRLILSIHIVLQMLIKLSTLNKF